MIVFRVSLIVALVSSNAVFSMDSMEDLRPANFEKLNTRPRISDPTYPAPTHQNSACPGVLGNGITSRMLVMPVISSTARSRPSPNPECGTVPYFLRSVYHQ